MLKKQLIFTFNTVVQDQSREGEGLSMTNLIETKLYY